MASISNLEDLDVNDFIDAVRRLGSMKASEKLDGTGLVLGRGDDGRLYTKKSRGSDKKFYSDTEFPYFVAMNGPRAATAALLKKEADIVSVLMPGDEIELEILYGRQPEMHSYGLDNKCFIAILGPAGETNAVKAVQLLSVLNNQEVTVKTINVDSDDGENLDRRATSTKFRFVDVPQVDTSKAGTLKFEKQLGKMQAFLDQESGVNNLSNYELLNVSMGSIPQEIKNDAKIAKDRVAATLKTKFKLGIKREIIEKLLSKVKPALSAADLGGDEDVGLTGIVLTDPSTGKMIKVLDREKYETLNSFNYAVRNQVSGPVRTLDDDAPLEARGGITGVMKIAIARTLGNPELALGRNAREIFLNNRGDTPVRTLKNVAGILRTDDFNGTKNKIRAVITNTAEELKQMLADFKKYKDHPEDKYQLRMKGKKMIGLSPEVAKRTMQMFAETKRNLEELAKNVDGAKTFESLVAVLYGRAAREAHDTVQVEEHLSIGSDSMLIEARQETKTDLFAKAPDALAVLNAYYATVMLCTVLLKDGDDLARKMIRDQHNFRMQKHDQHMSALNFWGMAVWHSSNVPSLPHEISAALRKFAMKTPRQNVFDLHDEYSHAVVDKINWAQHLRTLKLALQHTHGNNTDRLNKLLDDTFGYDELPRDKKIMHLQALTYFTNAFVVTSPLLTRIRAVHIKLLTGADEPVENDIDHLGDVGPGIQFSPGQTMKLLGEDGEVVTSPQPAPPLQTNAGSVGSVPGSNGPKKYQVVRRRRNPDAVVFKKFKKPEGQE